MRVPIILLSGAAGSGKDTVADFLVQNHGAVKIAQADPMKRLAMKLFGFSEETLWGPSERRNDIAPQSGFMIPDEGRDWVAEVLPDYSADQAGAYLSLCRWLDGVRTDLCDVPPTARHVLQTLGTEWGRAFSKNMWVDLALRNARTLLGGGHHYDRTVGVFTLPLADHAITNLVVIPDGRFRNEVLAVRAAGGATVKIGSPGAGLRGDAARHSSETEQDGIPDSWFDVVLENRKEHGLLALEAETTGLVTELTRAPHQRRTLSIQEVIADVFGK